MKFNFTADAQFEAADLDDALTLLAQHFLSLVYDMNTALEFNSGSVSVTRKRDNSLLD